MSINIKFSENEAREIVGFTQRLLGPIAEASDYLGDKIRAARWRSAIRTLSIAKDYANIHGVELNNIPTKFLVPFLEKSSLEPDENDLCETWARLLITASQDFRTEFISYTEILSKLDPQDVQLLQNMWSSSNEEYLNSIDNTLYVYGDSPDGDNLDFHSYHIDENTGIDEFGRYIVTNEIFPEGDEVGSVGGGSYSYTTDINHLEYLGLIKITALLGNSKGSKRYTIKATITPLGFSFISSCNKPLKGDREKAAAL
ncbi:Abi-alpha family protein [Halomonas sp. N3-2A]|uniref:Abi-alpha family protein n=1 Tax=Halomonas sp. N3-2A TaxID=2014541 RepID=UPI000B5B3E7D|nr:Abi-alpha family protein [Halomonas sp. N3-2A]ASK19567.1 hypothetical protein CEK60_09800 [Halomonas sp. N3-2A]